MAAKLIFGVWYMLNTFENDSKEVGEFIHAQLFNKKNDFHVRRSVDGKWAVINHDAQWR